MVTSARNGDDSARITSGLMILVGPFQLTRTRNGTYRFHSPTSCATNVLVNYHGSILCDHTWRSDDICISQPDFEYHCDFEQMLSFNDCNGRLHYR
jgi:hypothetical protein